LVISFAFGLSVITYIGIFLYLGGIILFWIIEYSLALAFGKDPGFGIGLILLPIIFFLILAFSKDAKYVLK
jgi:hypothetical protein